MDFESTSSDAGNSTPSGGGISRRSVVKAGAAAAWTVPLVQVVAAAPAVAVSGAPTLVLSGAIGSWNGNSVNLNGRVTLTNTGSAPTTSLQVTLTFDTAWTSGSASAGDWTVSPSGVATGNTYVFTAQTQLAANASTTLNFNFTSTTGKGFATVISVTASASNASSPASAQIQVEKAKQA